MITRRIAALAAALLSAFTIAAATTGGTAAASPATSLTVRAATLAPQPHCLHCPLPPTKC
jgi:hypothetical protein